jgi:hypothetical protein
VKEWWESYHFEGTPSFILARKLRALKLDLKKWNVEVFGNVQNRRRQAMSELNVLDVKAELRPLSSGESSENLSCRGTRKVFVANFRVHPSAGFASSNKISVRPRSNHREWLTQCKTSTIIMKRK